MKVPSQLRFIVITIFLCHAGFGHSEWFKTHCIAEGVWCIEDHGIDNFYLVQGKEKALLIDTGTGVANIRAYVQSLTSLPILVVNTHGHPDHAGGNFQFDSVFAHPADWDMIRKVNTTSSHREWRDRVFKENPEMKPFLLPEALSTRDFLLKPIREGDLFDLGERRIQVIETPGHTPGSICLWDSTGGLLFTGDNNNRIVWLFLEGALTVEGYLKTLERLVERANRIQKILPGHGEPLDGEFIQEQIQCAQQILRGECHGEPYHTFAGDAVLCSYMRAGIAFDPKRVFEKK